MSETPPPNTSPPSPTETSSQELPSNGSPTGTLVVIGILMVSILGMWGLVFTLMVLRS